MRQKLCGINLTGARGESRTIEVVLLHFIIPAVCYILSCMIYSTIKSSTPMTKQQQSGATNPFEADAVAYSTALVGHSHYRRCVLVNDTILHWHISAVSHGGWDLKHCVKWRRDRSQLFICTVGTTAWCVPTDCIIVFMERLLGLLHVIHSLCS